MSRLRSGNAQIRQSSDFCLSHPSPRVAASLAWGHRSNLASTLINIPWKLLHNQWQGSYGGLCNSF